jgi:serine/threonine-protein kinase
MNLPIKKIGKYEIQGELGVGSMGVVYKAWDPAIKREVAIKGLNKNAYQAGERESLLTRFRQKAQAVGRLVHPRIVQIYDFFEDEQSAYVIMELVHGKTLAQHLEGKETFGLWEVGQIISQTLDGIGYAHTQGVVHSDMKLANILINNDGRIKINFFGIARIETPTLARAGDLIGTPAYMSPEQFAGAEIDATTDLYSIGVIAYELVTGRKPFFGSPATLIQQVLYATPEKPSLLNTQLSPTIDNVLDKAMAKNRSERYQTASEFSHAFKRAVSLSLGLVDRRATASLPDAAKLLEAARMLHRDMIGESSESPPTELEEDRSILINTGIRQARLLIVDDDERILAALKSIFRQRYHVFTTTDGNKALDFITRYHMHVIISDQRMPVMLGVELLRRSREISPRSVRILLTGYSDLAAIVGSINDGEVYRFISKPWDNQSLQAVVAEASTIALELAETKTSEVSLPDKMKAGILVIDQDKEIFNVARELIGGLCPVVYAEDADSALDMLKKHEIAVVIADVESSLEQLTLMLKLLKQKYPQILSIIATNAKDAELVIDLINQAQVFRILHKPINVATLKAQVHAALQRYLIYQQTPELARAHKVEAPEKDYISSFAKNILKGLELLRR